MITAATAAAGKTRKAGAPTPTPANFINSNDYVNNTENYRLQFLNAAGVRSSRPVAAVIALHRWGGARG